MKNLIKNLVLVLTIIFSMFASAMITHDWHEKKTYNNIEKKIELKYISFMDSEGNTINLDDVDISNNKNTIVVKLEIESNLKEDKWEKFNQASYRKIAKQIARDVRLDTKTKGKIQVDLIREDNVTDEKVLLNSLTF